MSELYPSDSILLGLESDLQTGVDYIPTGQSPYYLAFRRLVQRLLLATGRANDLRVYQEDQLSVGVRAGRCVIHNTAIEFAGEEGLAVSNNMTTSFWLDSDGLIQSSTTGMPTDRTSHLPLAEVVTSAGSIVSLTDLRSEAFLSVADPTLLGLSASADEINQALDGITSSVTASALTQLTAGSTTDADTHHRHSQLVHDDDSIAGLTIVNNNAGSSSNCKLAFSLPAHVSGITMLVVDKDNGYLSQSFNGNSYGLVGTTHVQHVHDGDFTTSVAEQLIGVVPVSGVVNNVIVSVGQNIVSSNSADGVEAIVRINGTTVCTTNPKINSGAGLGLRNTAEGDGSDAVMKSDGSEQVGKGGLVSLEIVRIANGTISSDASDIGVLIVIKANTPE